MESDYDEDRSGWGDDMGRASEEFAGEEAVENPQEVLNECLEKFKTSDYIMEPGIYAQLTRYNLASQN